MVSPHASAVILRQKLTGSLVETKCFDVHSPETLKHNGGSDSQGIASAIKYAITNWGINPKRVYVTVSRTTHYPGTPVFIYLSPGHVLRRDDDTSYGGFLSESHLRDERIQRRTLCVLCWSE